ncbi:MarR family transcriptional regulator, partial [uncultured Mycolicibacterium sp.]|uniref:MarR family transcriptional regulator n=1 Tax=uncultured Mycolicibacterium sp. TaxID=2320817 RepID=UPI0032B205FA
MLSTTTVITAPAAPLVVAPRLGIADTAAAAVLAVIRRRGPITRDVIVKVTSLSAATVNRQVGTLIDAGLLQERP